MEGIARRLTWRECANESGTPEHGLANIPAVTFMKGGGWKKDVFGGKYGEIMMGFFMSVPGHPIWQILIDTMLDAMEDHKDCTRRRYARDFEMWGGDGSMWLGPFAITHAVHSYFQDNKELQRHVRDVSVCWNKLNTSNKGWPQKQPGGPSAAIAEEEESQWPKNSQEPGAEQEPEEEQQLWRNGGSNGASTASAPQILKPPPGLAMWDGSPVWLPNGQELPPPLVPPPLLEQPTEPPIWPTATSSAAVLEPTWPATELPAAPSAAPPGALSSEGNCTVSKQVLRMVLHALQELQKELDREQRG